MNDLFFDNTSMRNQIEKKEKRDTSFLYFKPNIAEDDNMSNQNNVAEITTAQNSVNNQEDILSLLEDTSTYEADNLTQPTNVDNLVSYLKERKQRIEKAFENNTFKNCNLVAKTKNGSYNLKFYCGKQPIAFKQRTKKDGSVVNVSQAIPCKDFDQAMKRLNIFISNVEARNESFMPSVKDAIERYNENMKNEPRLALGHS